MEETTQTTEVSQVPQKNTAIPAAIIIAGVLIAGAVLLKGNGLNTTKANNPQQPQIAQQISGDLEKIRPVSLEDHIRGNPDAPVKIVEYSDTECPFCKRFHETMKQTTAEYGDKVAWIYRHFPLDQLHSKARKEAVALECANEQGGNDKFWAYTDRLFEVTPANNGLDPAELPKIAQYVGLDVAKFNTCLASTKYDAHIENDVQNATETGGNGTPWSIVVAKNGKKYPLSGAQPYTSLKQLIDLALQEK